MPNSYLSFPQSVIPAKAGIQRPSLLDIGVSIGTVRVF